MRAFLKDGHFSKSKTLSQTLKFASCFVVSELLLDQKFWSLNNLPRKFPNRKFKIKDQREAQVGLKSLELFMTFVLEVGPIKAE